MRNIRFGLMALVGLCVLVGFAPPARAGLVIFGCDSVLTAAPPCSGTLTQSAGPNFATSNIVIFNTTGQYLLSQGFTLAFNTGVNNTITLTENGGGGDILTGTITNKSVGVSSFNSAFDTLTMNVSWTSLPAAVCAAAGATAPCAGNGIFSSVTFQIDGGTAKVVHVEIQPIPEPATMTLFGSGLVALGGLLRRKLGSLGSRS